MGLIKEPTVPSFPRETQREVKLAFSYLREWLSMLNNAISQKDVDFTNIPVTTTTPSAGGAGALPATPAGYVIININGTTRKIPYY